ncbi:zinc-dependent peptidase [Saprospiraceae bacterium]|nr:zinc-dependent peptidase [Saprospiraceae bacterium]
MYFKEIFSISVLIIFLAYVWWRLFFKQEEAIDKPFPKKWRSYLKKNVLFYKELSQSNQEKFEKRVLYFLSKVTIIGADTSVSSIDKLLVGTSAIIPIFGFENWFYNNLNEVLLYKNTFNKDYETEGDNDRNYLGMVGSGAMNRVMILVKPALHAGFKNNESKSNVGIHEFVHLIDKSDGATDGIPELFLSKPYVEPWVRLMHQEIDAIKKQESDINPYAATQEAEFFSVVSEYFFSRPHLFEEKHPELYDLLNKIYHRDEYTA